MRAHANVRNSLYIDCVYSYMSSALYHIGTRCKYTLLVSNEFYDRNKYACFWFSKL